MESSPRSGSVGTQKQAGLELRVRRSAGSAGLERLCERQGSGSQGARVTPKVLSRVVGFTTVT